MSSSLPPLFGCVFSVTPVTSEVEVEVKVETNSELQAALRLPRRTGHLLSLEGHRVPGLVVYNCDKVVVPEDTECGDPEGRESLNRLKGCSGELSSHPRTGLGTSDRCPPWRAYTLCIS